MSKRGKILLGTGIGILLLGIILNVTLFFVNITHLDKLQVNKTYQLEEFNSIDIDLVESNIKIVYSNENKVEFTETDSIYHELSYKNGTLNIKRKSKYYPFEWLFPTKSINMSMTLYLDENTLNEVDIDVVSGKVEIGKINANIIDIESVSGNINIDTAIANKIDVNTVSGSILLNNVNSSDVHIESVSGKIEADNVNAINTLELESVSGEINLLFSDAKNIKAKNVSGDITLNLKSGKVYTIKTISGKINKPENGANGFCNVETISGNINIEIIVLE